MSAVLETDVGHMRLSAGYRSTTTAAGRFAAPKQVGRGRRSGVLYALAAVENDADETIAHAVLQAAGRTFQKASGSLTTRLRRAVQAGSAALLQENLRRTSEAPRKGGVTCAVLRDNDLYLAQAGTTMACACQRGALIRLPEDDVDDRAGAQAFGRRHDPSVRLIYRAVSAGDTVMLADVGLVRQVGAEVLIEALSVADASLSLDNLAMALPAGEGPVLVLAVRGYEPPAPAPVAAPADAVPQPTRRPEKRLEEAEKSETFPAPAPPGPTLAERLESARAAASTWLAAASPVAGDWLRRLMPDVSPDRGRRRPADRKPGRKKTLADDPIWRPIALLLPVIVLLVVIGAYWKRGSDRQARHAERMAEVERQLGIAATADEATARQALEIALSTLDEAARYAPQDETVASLQTDVREQLDTLNKVFRIYHVKHLYTYPLSGEVDQLIVHGAAIYVLDRLGDRVYHHLLDASQTALESDTEKLLVHKGDQPDAAATVGDLVGMTWTAGGSGRLLILGRNGLLLAYDPTWERLTGTVLPANETWQYPVAVSSYLGNFYVLDAGVRQVFRYRADGIGYTSPPEHYFAQEEEDVADAIDMAIDGFIYLLFKDGHLEKYLAGEPAPITLDVPDRPLQQPSAIYAAPDEEAMFLYIADPPNQRVLRCDKEGRLIHQFVLEGSDALSQVRDIYADELHDRLFFLSDNRLFVMDILPP